MGEGCRVLLDTNIIITLSSNRAPCYLRDALRSFLEGLGRNCGICYHAVSVKEMGGIDASLVASASSVLSALGASSCGPDAGVLLPMLGRYQRWVRRLGVNDVLIALAARENRAVLVTGDYRLASFYATLTRVECEARDRRRGSTKRFSPKPFIYIPLPVFTGPASGTDERIRAYTSCGGAG